MIRAYLAERLRPVTFIPLAGLIALAAAGGRIDVSTLALDAGIAWLLLAEFRLWDDLADRGADTVRYPHRVLVRATSTTPFVRAAILLALAGLLGLFLRNGWGYSLMLLALLHVALGAWYCLRTVRTLPGDQLLLAKYPAFVLILAGPRMVDAPVAIASAAALIYTAASLYEAWHDPVSPLGTLLGGRS